METIPMQERSNEAAPAPAEQYQQPAMPAQQPPQYVPQPAAAYPPQYPPQVPQYGRPMPQYPPQQMPHAAPCVPKDPEEKKGLAVTGFVFGVIGMLLFCMMCYAVLLIYVPLGLLTPILLIFGSCGFMATYAAFPKIKAVMIDPYYTEPEEEEDDFEPVFRDMG